MHSRDSQEHPKIDIYVIYDIFAKISPNPQKAYQAKEPDYFHRDNLNSKNPFLQVSSNTPTSQGAIILKKLSEMIEQICLIILCKFSLQNSSYRSIKLPPIENKSPACHLSPDHIFQELIARIDFVRHFNQSPNSIFT